MRPYRHKDVLASTPTPIARVVRYSTCSHHARPQNPFWRPAGHAMIVSWPICGSCALDSQSQLLTPTSMIRRGLPRVIGYRGTVENDAGDCYDYDQTLFKDDLIHFGEVKVEGGLEKPSLFPCDTAVCASVMYRCKWRTCGSGSSSRCHMLRDLKSDRKFP